MPLDQNFSPQLKQMLIVICKVVFFLALACSQPENNDGFQEDLDSFIMKEGLKRIKIITETKNAQPETIATLFAFSDTAAWRFQFISREKFDGIFRFGNVEKMAVKNRMDLALQVVAAFTPDWKVIEGFALENGIKVGEDGYLGENLRINYKGVLLLNNNQLKIFNVDSIPDKEDFVAKALDASSSMFQQVLAIYKGKKASDLDLPGTYKRRFIVEMDSAGVIHYGIVSFVQATSYHQAVDVLQGLTKIGITVKNALYLDMGSVSEGWFYDRMNQRSLIGNPDADMQKYTNLLILSRPLAIGATQ